jgi:hypothetical protein
VAHCGFEPQSSPTKHFKIGFCCFSIKHKYCLAWNQDNVSRMEWHVYPQTCFSVLAL